MEDPQVLELNEENCKKFLEENESTVRNIQINFFLIAKR